MNIELSNKIGELQDRWAIGSYQDIVIGDEIDKLVKLRWKTDRDYRYYEYSKVYKYTVMYRGWRVAIRQLIISFFWNEIMGYYK